ncbi:MAG: RNA polymerase sigma factor [Verrucomicrobiales bacterium]|nr:RNA polymerase sigma factor [Verrucomicrobiales bacterium]
MIRELEFQLLCQRHRDELFRYARALLGNNADAEDATQEVLVRLWHQLPTLHFFNLRGWLFRTTRNYCLDQMRQRSSTTFPLDEETLEQEEDEFAIDPSRAADVVDRLEQANGVLRRLPESLRSVFVLYEINQLRYREIAEALGIPINTVKVRLLRARQALARLVRKEDPWPIPLRK